MTQKKTATKTATKTVATARPAPKRYTSFAQACLDNKAKKAGAGIFRFGGGQTLIVDVDETTLQPGEIADVVAYVVKDRRSGADHRVTSVLRLIS